MSRMYFLSLLTTILILFSCKENKKDNITGYYEIDKTVSRNRENNEPDFRILIINKNNSFELRKNRNDTINTIKGKIELEHEKNNETIVTFFYDNRKITGKLEGTIFYFSYPNDFHTDKYESILYVKLKK